MKQVEITVAINGDLNGIMKILFDKGFSIIRTTRIEDEYLSQKLNELSPDNILPILSDAILLRHLNVNGRIIKLITHKKKTYAENGDVLGLEETNVPCGDLAAAKKLFENIGFQNLVNVNYDMVVMSNGQIELAFQTVEGLGLMLECESTQDFADKSNEEILQEKARLIEEAKAQGIEINEIREIKKAYELLKMRLKS
ncbi:MAG: hypothetical protein FWF97_00735 [Alphaproteobacteria bacterium]|nr:hypothetical protein [Alphaproteobacteria bacterium]